MTLLQDEILATRAVEQRLAATLEVRHWRTGIVSNRSINDVNHSESGTALNGSQVLRVETATSAAWRREAELLRGVDRERASIAQELTQVS